MSPHPSSTLVQCDAERNPSLLIPANLFIDKNMEARNKSEDAPDSAFSSLVDRHARLVYRIAFSLLRNTQDAEDAVQEMFLKLYKRNTWRQMRDEKAFLAKAVWRVALNLLPRRKEQSLDPSYEYFADKGDSPETNAIRNAQAALLRRMIDTLPEDLRQVLVLSAIDDLNSREVGLLIGIPEGTVRTRLMRARVELKRRFESAQGKSNERL